MTPDELASRALLARILWWRKNLEKLDAYAVNTLLKTLASANANIRAQIKKDLPKVWDKLNYKEFRLWLGETTKPALDAVTDTITESWAVSATQSLNAYNSILSFDGQAKNIQQVPITVDTVKALAASSPFAGQKLATLVQAIFHDGVAATMLQCVDDAMKKGWGYKKVVKSLLNEAIDKGFQITQTQAITLSRSYIQQASVNAQMAVYEKNKDVVKGVKWTAILDNRVCGKCAALDGQTYAWDEQRPPLIPHPRCRCLWLPWLKSYRDLGLDIDDLEEAERNWVIREGGNIDAGGNRKILEVGTTKENFPGWWKTLPYKEQIKSIGPTRTELINSGQLKWSELVDRNTGRYYTLAELKITETKKSSRANSESYKPESIIWLNEKINEIKEGTFQARGISKQVGELDNEAMKFLKNENITIENNKIYMVDKDLRHALRDIKPNKIPYSIWDKIPILLEHNKGIFWNKKKGAFVYCIEDENTDIKAKIIIQINQKMKKIDTFINKIRTGATVANWEEFRNMGEYFKIK